MTRNLRRQLADAAERWMRAWAGDDLPRESAEVLYTYWDLADPNDDELRGEVLSRFSPAEPPAVEGKDYLTPRTATDWSRYDACPTCLAPTGRCCRTTYLGMACEVPHRSRSLVEFAADAAVFVAESVTEPGEVTA